MALVEAKSAARMKQEIFDLEHENSEEIDFGEAYLVSLRVPANLGLLFDKVSLLSFDDSIVSDQTASEKDVEDLGQKTGGNLKVWKKVADKFEHSLELKPNIL